MTEGGGEEWRENVQGRRGERKRGPEPPLLNPNQSTSLPLRPCRNSVASLREQASSAKPMPMVSVPFHLSGPPSGGPLEVCMPIEPRVHRPEEEIAFGPACWLWDYLR